MDRSSSGPGPRLRAAWARLNGKPGGRWLFSRMLGWLVPYSGTVAARVTQLEPGFARVELRDRRRVRNHLRSIHAIALVNLGELATGLAFNCGVPSGGRAILVGISAEYLKKARGTLVATSRCTVPGIAGDSEVEVPSEIVDASGTLVARVSARWRIGPTPAGRG